MRWTRWKQPVGLLSLVLLLTTTGAFAQEAATAVETVEQVVEEAPITADEVQTNLNWVWTLIAAALVFFMQPGFAMVEVGFTRAKNAVNIIMKNLIDFSVGSIMFFVIGFGLMFGVTEGWFGTSMFLPTADSLAEGGTDWVFVIFQTVFAATAATIVSGAVAERTKFTGYLVYSVLITAFIYPVFGSWAWGGLVGDTGGGWLEGLGFLDFAGSTVVHSVGGWLALAGAIVLGPRLGKFGPDGKPRAIMGHNIPMAALGVFILWFGWFGFNCGSTTTGDISIGHIAMTTNLSAAAGVITAMITAWIIFKKPDGTMALNGALAGLVGITAGCDCVSPSAAILIGSISGILVVLSVLFIERVLKVDDPVGAVSVHGVCGAWGTLAVGLFYSEASFGVQALGVATAFAWAFGLGMLLFLAIKYTVGLRVSAEDERRGLDISEHGNDAYSGFQIFSNM